MIFILFLFFYFILVLLLICCFYFLLWGLIWFDEKIRKWENKWSGGVCVGCVGGGVDSNEMRTERIWSVIVIDKYGSHN